MTSKSPSDPFQGFYTPRTTQVPDNFFDHVMADLSGAETKVLLYIFRRTFGFKKDADNISLSQMVNGITRKNGQVLDRGTGLGKTSVMRALTGLVLRGMIRKTRRSSRQSGDEATTYEPVLMDELPVVQNGSRGVPKRFTPVSQNGTHKRTGNNKQLDNTVNGGKTPIRQLPDLGERSERAELVIHDILDLLGDRQSEKFYRLVATKIPETVIRKTLAEIKTDGAQHPPKVFTYRMNQYALDQLKQGIGK